MQVKAFVLGKINGVLPSVELFSQKVINIDNNLQPKQVSVASHIDRPRQVKAKMVVLFFELVTKQG